MNISQKILDDLCFCFDETIALEYEKKYNNGDYSFECEEHEIIFLDSLATAFSNSYGLNNRDEYVISKELKFYKPILLSSKSLDIYYSMNRRIMPEYIDSINRIHINLGNYYANQYRYCEAMEQYNRVLNKNDKYGMALLAKAICIENNPVLLNFIDSEILLKYLIEIYSKIRISSFDDEGRNLNDFCRNKILKLKEIEKDKSYKKSFKFNEMIMIYGYFLNPLDELSIDDIEDIIPNNLFLRELFNEFIFCRDKLTKIDYSDDEEEIRFLNVIFQKYYSFFDRVAYFLNYYFKIGITEEKINIKSIFEKDILDYKNPYLYAIYWNTLEYREYKNRQSSNPYLPYDYRKIEERRNILEHRIEKIDISKIDDIRDVTLKLESVIRNILIYCLFLSSVEEQLGHTEILNRDKSIEYKPTFQSGLFGV